MCMCALRSKKRTKARSVFGVDDSKSKDALLEARALRVDIGGSPDIDGLSFTSSAKTGKSAIVLGAPRALFEAAAGLVRASSGDLLIGGEDAAEGARSGLIAAAPA